MMEKKISYGKNNVSTSCCEKNSATLRSDKKKLAEKNHRLWGANGSPVYDFAVKNVKQETNL